jgi:ribosomal protein S18 acetylase RimI-like enzyme
MDVFATIAATWPPAETRRLGPWTLRRGGGAGSRVSAATLDGPLGGIEAAEAAMRAWGQPPLVMVRPGEDALDAALAARGYAVRDVTRALAAPVEGLAPRAADERAIDCAGPLACMVELWAAGGIGAARLDVMARAAGPKAWLLGRDGDRPAACAFVAVAGEVAMLHALHVDAAARRRGLGEIVTRVAAGWAEAAGARRLALVVTETNAPARALYARLGFADVGRYHYRAAAA